MKFQVEIGCKGCQKPEGKSVKVSFVTEGAAKQYIQLFQAEHVKPTCDIYNPSDYRLQSLHQPFMRIV